MYTNGFQHFVTDDKFCAGSILAGKIKINLMTITRTADNTYCLWQTRFRIIVLQYDNHSY